MSRLLSLLALAVCLILFVGFCAAFADSVSRTDLVGYLVSAGLMLLTTLVATRIR